MGGPWVHRLSDVDEQSRTAMCSYCGHVKIHKRLTYADGRINWACGTSRRMRKDADLRPYRFIVGKKCERCGFVPEHIRQLDVHHKDNNRENNSLSNLETLCANCHRLMHV